MKIKNKLFGMILVLISLIVGTSNINADSYEGYIYWREQIPNTYVTKIKNGEVKHDEMTLLRRSTDMKFVYCVEPGTNVTNYDKYQIHESNQAKILNISEEQWERATLLAYYGYGYGNHTDSKWYSVTQYLIWKTVSPEVTVYFTDVQGGKKIDKYTSEIAELERLVKEHYKTPSFSNKSFKVGVNNRITLTDENSVLKNYKVSSSEGINTLQNGNNLTIVGLKLGNYTINLTKEDTKYSAPPIVYTSNVSQDVMSVGKFPTLKTKFNVEVKGGDLKVTKYGENLLYVNNTYKYENKLLKDVVFELYANEDIYNLLGELVFKKDEKITEMKTDENGIATFENALYLGSYYLLEKESAEGHVLDKTKHEFEIEYDKNNNLKEEIELYNYLPKGSLKLLKINHKGEALSGAYFEIFNKDDNLVFRGYTDENGYINIEKLPLGKYYIKEIKAPNGYKINKKVINFEINKNGEIVNIKAKNDLIVKVPITEKNEFPVVESIGIVLILMGISGGIIYVIKKNKNKK